MNCAVRYYSRSGNTKTVAVAIAEEIGVKAISIDSAHAALKERVDVLFLGGALYVYGLDKNMKEYINTIDPSKVGKVVLFSTASMSQHALDLMRKGLEAKGISVERETFFIKGKQASGHMREAAEFAKKFV